MTENSPPAAGGGLVSLRSPDPELIQLRLSLGT
jgi:hypothetical protein